MNFAFETDELIDIVVRRVVVLLGMGVLDPPLPLVNRGMLLDNPVLTEAAASAVLRSAVMGPAEIPRLDDDVVMTDRLISPNPVAVVVRLLLLLVCCCC